MPGKCSEILAAYISYSKIRGYKKYTTTKNEDSLEIKTLKLFQIDKCIIFFIMLFLPYSRDYHQQDSYLEMLSCKLSNSSVCPPSWIPCPSQTPFDRKVNVHACVHLNMALVGDARIMPFFCFEHFDVLCI